MLGSDTDPDPPDPSGHALDVDPDPDLDPAKLCRSDQIRIRIHIIAIYATEK
jgi:hypothetical protein